MLSCFMGKNDDICLFYFLRLEKIIRESRSDILKKKKEEAKKKAKEKLLEQLTD